MSQAFTMTSLTDPVGPTQGGTGITTYATGDVLYASAVNTLAKLPIGTVNQVLTVSAGGIPSWSAAGTASPLTTKGDVYTYSTTEARLGVGADTFVLTADSAEATGLKWAAGGGATPPKVYWFAAESLQPLETNSAAIFKLAGSNVKTFVRAFDTSTEEFANGKLEVPADVSTTGSDLVTFRAYVMASTAAASKNVKLTFGHIPLNTGEDFDQAYTDVSIDDQAIDATQDNITQIEWTASLTTLGWSAEDLIPFRFSREAATTNNLATDMYLFSFSITIPRA